MANASGGTGTIRYMFTAEMNGREILIRNFDAEESLTWKPANSGTYKITAYAINRGKIISESTTTTYTAR